MCKFKLKPLNNYLVLSEKIKQTIYAVFYYPQFLIKFQRSLIQEETKKKNKHYYIFFWCFFLSFFFFFFFFLRNLWKTNKTAKNEYLNYIFKPYPLLFNLNSYLRHKFINFFHVFADDIWKSLFMQNGTSKRCLFIRIQFNFHFNW